MAVNMSQDEIFLSYPLPERLVSCPSPCVYGPKNLGRNARWTSGFCKDDSREQIAGFISEILHVQS